MIRTLRYTLHIKGDLHSGTGMGLPGLIDELVLRDADGLAYLPGSHIKGLVRDSCYRLWQAQGEDNLICEGQKEWMQHTTGPEPEASLFCSMQGRDLCLICALFGAASTKGGFWFSPAKYPDAKDLAALDLGTSDGALRAQTALDPLTKRAKPNQLFQIEVVQPLDQFEGEFHFLGWAGKPRLDDDNLVAWLTASLLFTRRLGGNRRRGWGRSRFSLDTHDPESRKALDALTTWLGEEAT